MSINPPTGSIFTEEPETPQSPEGPRNWFSPAVIAALVVLAIVNIFLLYDLSTTRTSLDQRLAEMQERSSVLMRRLEANIQANDERHNDLRGELMVAQEKLGMTRRDLARARKLSQALGEEQKRAAAQIGQQVSTLREESTARLGELTGGVTTNKADIVSTRKDLEETKLQLTTAVGDLSKANVLIARNGGELEELRRRGERNYFEFDLRKQKRPSRVGNISLKLKKTNTKRQRYTLELYADDKKVEKKNKTVNEPVQFYMARSRGLHEIVVNQVHKNRIVGYVSSPK